MSMNCRDIEFSLDERLDGRLDPASQRAFDEHVAGCAGCRQTWQAYAGAWQTLARQAAVEPSHGFVERTLRRLDEPERTRHPSFWRWPVVRWSALAGLMTVIALGAWLQWQHRKNQREAEMYALEQQGQLEDFDVIAALDQLKGGNQL